MAHFAEIDSNNIVTRVLVIPDSEEQRGAEFLSNDLNLGGRWIQTSFSGRIRKRFAGVGMIYDEERDAFYNPKAHASFVFDEEACIWKAPVPYPTDGKIYAWDEESVSWQGVEWIQPPNLALPESSNTDAADISHSDE
jgi:hypothetical protein